jgi:hypothetical protein
MIRLLELRDGTARPVLPEGRDPAGWHQALSQEIAAHLTPEHAALLATPVRGEASVAWFAPGTALRRYGELEAADRDRLTAAAGAILSDIRRLAESGAAPMVTAAWPALRTVPDLAHLFAVDGRPVLAGWGFAAPAGGAGPMAGFDDSIAWRAPPRLAWPVYGGMLAALAGLALFAGLVLVPLGVLMQPSPAICRMDPVQLALLREQSREAARSDALRAQLAQLQEQHGERALQCPIPREVVSAPPPPAPPPPRADLPEDRWNRRDLSMLEGCWNSTTPLRIENERTHHVRSVRSWQYCFDAHGRGHQSITLEDGDRCEGDMSATFESNGQLQMRDLARCRLGSGPLLLGQLRCHRISDSEAQCRREELEGQKRGQIMEGRFRRAGAPEPPAAGPGAVAK